MLGCNLYLVSSALRLKCWNLVWFWVFSKQCYMLRVSCIVVEMLVLFIFSIFLTVLYVKFLALWLKCWYLAWFTSLPRGLFLSRANFSSAFSCLSCKCLFNLSHQRETPQHCFFHFSTFTFHSFHKFFIFILSKR